MQVGTQVTPHDSVGAYAFLDYFKHLNYLAVGPNEIADFDLSRGVRPRKILITSDSEDVLRRCLNDIAYSGTLAGIPSNVLHDGLWIPSWNSSCTRLRSLHIISMNQHSELTGAPMPVSELEQLRSGSLAEHSLIQCHQLPPGEEGSQGYSAVKIESGLGENTYSRIPVNQSTQDRFWTEHGQGSTNIRYDTRKFSFRPCEITASRLRPFFEELTTTFAREVDERNRAQAFSHKGPRHAAPRRGAGNFSSSSKNEEFDGGEVTAKRAVLGLFGCNKFRKLHLCWDPMPTGTQDLSHDDPGTRLNGRNQGRASTKSAGETDWPVERQDIWTNTSSQNNEAKAPPPHTFSKGQPISAQKRSIPRANGINQSPEKDSAVRKKPLPSWVIPSAMESTQSKAFRADMVDAFRTTIGWTRHDQELLKDTEWFIRGASLNDDSLDPLDNFISEYHHVLVKDNLCTHPIAKLPPTAPEEKVTLRIVPPAERLRLGGIYVPYTKHQRVQWFLDNLETDDA
nr:hypothetical protein BN887_02771 [Melanopsichium pennsylvanicum 4]